MVLLDQAVVYSYLLLPVLYLVVVIQSFHIQDLLSQASPGFIKVLHELLRLLVFIEGTSQLPPSLRDYLLVQSVLA